MGSPPDDEFAERIFRKMQMILAYRCRSADLSARSENGSEGSKCFIFKLRAFAGEKNFPPTTRQIGTNYIFYPMTR